MMGPERFVSMMKPFETNTNLKIFHSISICFAFFTSNEDCQRLENREVWYREPAQIYSFNITNRICV